MEFTDDSFDIPEEDLQRLRLKAFRCLEQRVDAGCISDLGLLYLLFGRDTLKDWAFEQLEEA